MITIVGVHNYTGADLCAAVAFLSDTGDRHPFDALVAAPHPLEQIGAALAGAGVATLRQSVLP